MGYSISEDINYENRISHSTGSTRCLQSSSLSFDSMKKQDKITQIVTGSSTSIKHSMYDEYVQCKQRGRCLPKEKASRKVVKAHNLNGDPPVMIIGNQVAAPQGHQCPKYHPRRQPGEGCAICGSTRHPTSQCTRPVKSKAKHAEYDESVGEWGEPDWQEDQCENEEYEVQKVKKGKGKGSKPKGKSKGKTTPRSIAPRSTQSSPTKNEPSPPQAQTRSTFMHDK